ncbi:hypothetical protein PILCRDRAFT_12746 [Piloderma croceum F 1598]|uniref:Uncharacterized protein n=1 Tax=Piloderma croceum (strain F 1598) TaxID=765440 RepID=A0A0C3EVG5_PILCF|nr:hypothetical protein PILCRDRAFT_12746 [Piloderma croceum F 1598]
MTAAPTYSSDGSNRPPTHTPDARYPVYASGVSKMVRVWSAGVKVTHDTGNGYLDLDEQPKTAESLFSETSNDSGVPVEHVADPKSQTSVPSGMNKKIHATNTINWHTYDS